MILRELFEPNLTHLVALLSHPIRSLLGAHSNDIVHQESKLFPKEEHLLADVIAYYEGHIFEVNIFYFFYLGLFMRHVLTRRRLRNGRECGENFSRCNRNRVSSALFL